MYIYVRIYFMYEKGHFLFRLWLQAYLSRLHSSNKAEFAHFVSLDTVNIFICRNWITPGSFK